MRICEMFRSVQGEGIMIGSVTFFIRTVGCNLSCSWCDTPYSREGGEELSVDDIMSRVKNENNICITGGEPLLQNDIYDLIDALLGVGKKVVMETNGSVDISKVPVNRDMIISMDIKCPSSGMNDKMMISNIGHLKSTDQLKFVISGRSDMEYAESFISSREIKCNIILIPAGGTDIKPLAEEVLGRRMNVRVLPQLHKIIWGNERAV